MKHTVIAATAIMLLSAFPVLARPPVAVLEDGREITPAMLMLPSSLDGTVSLGCPGCKLTSLTLSREAKFFIGKQEVSFADLKRHLKAYPKSSVLVVSPIHQKVITRISASVADVK